MTIVFVPFLHAQSQEPEEIKPVPVLTGGAGFITVFEDGNPELVPLISPVLLVPIGKRWLIESRTSFEAELAQPAGSGTFRGKVAKEVEYLQLDFIANPYLTVTVGRYLTPFGSYNERLYPVWIRNLQADPLIQKIAIGEGGAGTGAMLRGGFKAHPQFNFNYAVYFSALSTREPLNSDRFAGGRLGIFIPKARLEIGGSFQHLLQDERSNSFGFHSFWQPTSLPLDIRAEYARSSRGSGYWIEPAYRLSQLPFWQNAMRRTQIVARVQQFFVGKLSSDAVPSVNTKQLEFGANYYILDGFRATGSYGREFSPEGDGNIWTFGLTYRFLIPLGHGDVK